MRGLWRFLIMAVLSLLAACASHRQPPENAPTPVQEPAVESSSVDLPVTLNLQRLRVQLLRSLPQLLSAGATTLQGPMGMAVIAQHRVSIHDLGLRVYGQNYRVVIDADVSILADLGHGVRVGCAPQAPGRARFILDGHLDAEQGHLQARAHDWQVQWLRACQLSPLAVNLDQVLSLPLLRDQLKAQIDASLADALGPQGMTAALAGIWPTLNQPLPLGQGLWLLLHPQSVAVGDVHGTGVLLQLRLQMRAQPELLGQRPAPAPLPAMPPLASLSPEQGAHLALRIALPLERADALLDANLAHRPWSLGGHQVELAALRTYGHGDQAVLSLDLVQPLSGRIDLYARPQLDTAAGTLSFVDPDYTLDTQSTLARSAAWMLGPKVRHQLAERLQLHFSDLPKLLSAYTKAPQRISWAGGSLGVQLHLEALQVRYLAYTPTELHALLVADGHLQLEDD